MSSIVLFVMIQTEAKLIKRSKILRPGLSKNVLFISTLPMMIQLPGKSTNFGSKILVCSRNN